MHKIYSASVLAILLSMALMHAGDDALMLKAPLAVQTAPKPRAHVRPTIEPVIMPDSIWQVTVLSALVMSTSLYGMWLASECETEKYGSAFILAGSTVGNMMKLVCARDDMSQKIGQWSVLCDASLVGAYAMYKHNNPC